MTLHTASSVEYNDWDSEDKVYTQVNVIWTEMHTAHQVAYSINKDSHG